MFWLFVKQSSPPFETVGINNNGCVLYPNCYLCNGDICYNFGFPKLRESANSVGKTPSATLKIYTLFLHINKYTRGFQVGRNAELVF